MSLKNLKNLYTSDEILFNIADDDAFRVLNVIIKLARESSKLFASYATLGAKCYPTLKPATQRTRCRRAVAKLLSVGILAPTGNKIGNGAIEYSVDLTVLNVNTVEAGNYAQSEHGTMLNLSTDYAQSEHQVQELVQDEIQLASKVEKSAAEPQSPEPSTEGLESPYVLVYRELIGREPEQSHKKSIASYEHGVDEFRRTVQWALGHKFMRSMRRDGRDHYSMGELMSQKTRDMYLESARLADIERKGEEGMALTKDEQKRVLDNLVALNPGLGAEHIRHMAKSLEAGESVKKVREYADSIHGLTNVNDLRPPVQTMPQAQVAKLSAPVQSMPGQSSDVDEYGQQRAPVDREVMGMSPREMFAYYAQKSAAKVAMPEPRRRVEIVMESAWGS